MTETEVQQKLEDIQAEFGIEMIKPEELDFSTMDLDWDRVKSNFLASAYSQGFQGTRPDSQSYREVRESSPRFHSAFPEAKGSGKGRVSLPFRAIQSLHSRWGGDESQDTGDCVSMSTRNAGELDYGIDALFGETVFLGRFANEPIYGYRGHAGQGANCSRLALYVGPRGPGGFLVRKDYGRGVDLSVYNARTGHNWGRSGTPKWLNEIADDNKAQKIFAIKTIDEAIDAIACGFGISMCSSLGFSSRRDENGVSARRGSWAHAMAWIAVDDTDWAHQMYGGPLILVQNSWGENWINGGTRLDQPKGSFWIRAKDALTMIRGGGGWAITSVVGYNREKLMDRRSLVYDLAA